VQMGLKKQPCRGSILDLHGPSLAQSGD